MAGTGLLDSALALAAVAELTSDATAQLVLEQQERPSNLTAAATAALLGVLVQLGAPIFADEPEVVRDAARRQLGQATDASTRALFEELVRDGGRALAARRGSRSPPLADALGTNLDHAIPSGAYASEASRAVLAELVEDCAVRVDQAVLRKRFDPRDAHFDGFVAALAILGGRCIEPKRIAIWRARFQGAIAGVAEHERADCIARLRSFDLACEHLATKRNGAR